MAEKDLTIAIRTTADTSGAEKAVVAIGRVDKAAEDAAIHAEMQAQRNARTAGVTFDNPVYSENVSKAAAELDKLAPKADMSGKNLGKMGQLANQASYQIQDFAVQVGGGTSALTSFAQQAPQMLGALSSAGVLSSGAAVALGGIGAAIPIIAFGLPALAKALSDTGESAAEVAKRIDDLSKKAEAARFDKLDRAADALAFAHESAVALTQEFSATQKAQDAYASAAISNADRILKLQNGITAALGLQVNEIAKLDAAAKTAAEARALAMQQAKDAQQKLLDDSLTAEQRQADKIEEIRANQAAREAERSEATIELAWRQAKKNEALAYLANPLPGDVTMPSSGFGQVSLPGFDPRASAAAKATVKDEMNNKRITALEATVTKLNEQLKAIGSEGGTGTLQKALVTAENLGNKTTDLAGALLTTVKTLEESDAISSAQEKLDLVVAKQSTDAGKITEALATITAANDTGRATTESLSALAKDGKLTADESSKSVQDSQKLVGLLQSNQVLTNGNNQATIAILTQVINNQNKLQADLSALRGRLPQ